MKFKMLIGGALLAPFISIPHALSAHHEEAVVEAAVVEEVVVEEATANPDCQLTIEASDTMQYNILEMSAPASCAEVTVTLVHTGRLPKEGMGHNWVLTTSADFNDVANAGMREGLSNNYLPAGDARVIAGSQIIGGGDSTSVTFATSGMTADESYTYFCSFPGHWGMMKGSFKLV
jgi:azurin